MLDKDIKKNSKRPPKGQRTHLRRMKQKARNEAILVPPKK